MIKSSVLSSLFGFYSMSAFIFGWQIQSSWAYSRWCKSFTNEEMSCHSWQIILFSFLEWFCHSTFRFKILQRFSIGSGHSFVTFFSCVMFAVCLGSLPCQKIPLLVEIGSHFFIQYSHLQYSTHVTAIYCKHMPTSLDLVIQRW